MKNILWRKIILRFLYIPTIGEPMCAQTFGPYILCMWKVLSEIELPELPLAGAEALEEPALRVSLGSVAQPPAAGFVVTDGGDVLLRIPVLGDFFVSRTGDEVIVQAQANVDPLQLRNCLYGSVLATVCYLRGLFPLHGSSVLMHDAAIAFSGQSGAGKSTLAMAVARRGHPLLSDDVCALDLRDTAHPMLRPAIPRTKLFADTIDHFQLGASDLYTHTARGSKGHFSMAGALADTRVGRALPLRAVYMLDARDQDQVSLVALRGKNCFSFWMQQAHRSVIGYKLGFRQRIFQQVSVLASTVPVYLLRRPRRLSALESTVQLLEQGPFGIPSEPVPFAKSGRVA
jgi:hypothetical protein